ncbi:YhgE/Pip domain-containing protein [Clostridium malenominatum]|uniref:YhgE/Pip domain-containing protein n=1 Tax=Clostridium malenominatum TaxID=1539 RepID=A0ABN1J2R3_9CLOT
MNFLKVAKRDISSIFKNRFIRVSVTAIIIVPLLYSLLYLYAFWDPYNRLHDMPVAVVNMDKGSIKDNEEVNYGKNVVDNLKGNDKIGWKFVSIDEAEKGLKAKKGYYAMFVIPEDFSKKIISAKDGKPEQPEIIYTSNDKKNFLAAQINGKVSGELKAEIVKSITKEYTKATFDSLFELKDGLNKAADGSTQLKDGMIKAQEGTEKLKGGVVEFKKNVPTMEEGVRKLYNGSSELSNGLKLFKVNLDKLTRLSSKGSLEALKNPNTIKGAETLMKDAVVLKDADTSILEIVPGIMTPQNIQVLGKVALDFKEIDINSLTNIPEIKTLTKAENMANVNKLLKDTESLSTIDMNKMLPLMSMLNNSDKLVSLLDSLEKLGNADASLNDLALMQNQVKENTALINNVKTSLSKENVEYLNNILPQLATLKGDLDKNGESLTAVKSLVNKVSTDKNMQASLDKLQVLQQDLNTAKPIILAIQKNITPEQMKNLANGPKLLNQLLKMQKDLKDNEKLLQVAQNALTEDNIKMAESLIAVMPTVSEGVNKLYNGSLALNGGLKELNEKVPQLSEGVSKLYNGTDELYTGMTKLTEGSEELSDKLKEGSDKINKNLVNNSDTMGKFVSEPVIMAEKPIYAVKNYGSGFAPYFIPLSLWVGVIMMFFIITDKVDADVEAGPVSIVAGKFLSYGFIGLLQSVLASIIVLALGLKPDNIPLYFAFNIFMSFVFIAIIQCLIFLLGQAGRLLSIVLLIFQLTSCAGTFPLEIVPRLFKVLNPLMPFTYCVSGLREVISGVDYSILGKDIAVLGGMLVVFFIISIMLKEHADKVQLKVQGEMNNISK